MVFRLDPHLYQLVICSRILSRTHRFNSDDPLSGALGQGDESSLDSSGIGRLRRIVEQDDDADSLIYLSDEADSLFRDELGSPGRFLEQQRVMEETVVPLSPPRRPPIYDPETGEEMKIPEMSDEEFNENFGEHLARTGQGAQTAQRSAEALAAASESGTGGAMAVAGAVGVGVVAGIGMGVKKLLEADDNNFDNLDIKHTEKTDQAAYLSNNVAQTTTQTTQATPQAAQTSAQATAQAGQSAAQAAAASTP